MRDGDDIICVCYMMQLQCVVAVIKGFLEAINTRPQFKLVTHYWFFLFDNHALLVCVTVTICITRSSLCMQNSIPLINICGQLVPVFQKRKLRTNGDQKRKLSKPFFLLLVLIAGHAGAIFLLRVPIAGLSSGCIGIVVFFLAFCGAFGLAFALPAD